MTMKGISVTVLRPSVATVDRFGNEVPGEPTRETVADVLIEPGATSDLEASRPEGVVVAYTLHFPKTFTASLEGCMVELTEGWHNGSYIRGGTYRVIGAPSPYMTANTPTRWNMPVEVETAHG